MPSPTTPLLRISSPPAADNGKDPGPSSGSDFRQAMGHARQDGGDASTGATDRADAAATHPAKADSADGRDRSGTHDQDADASADATHPAQTAAKDDGKDTTTTRDSKTDKHSPDPTASGVPTLPVLNLIEVARRQPAAVTGKALPPEGTLRAAHQALPAGATNGSDARPRLTTTALTQTATGDAAGQPGAGGSTPAPAALAGIEPGRHSDGATRTRDHAFAQLLAATPGAGAAMQAPSPATASAAAHHLVVDVPPQSAPFAPAVGQHVAWLAGQEIKDARIQLHPRDLGPINVHVQVHHDRVDVSFAVQHPDTVHALQQTLPQLDSLLARHGLSLGQASVDQQQSRHPHGGGGGGAPGADGGAIDAETTALPRATRAAIGLVDAFA